MNQHIDSAPILPPPILSHESGFYDEPFKLTIHHLDPDVEILYTLDGSIPTPESLGGKTFQFSKSVHTGSSPFPPPVLKEFTTTSFAYSDPVCIGKPDSNHDMLSFIPTAWRDLPDRELESERVANVIRVRAFKSGVPPSPTASRTFIINESEFIQSGIHIASVTVDPVHLFDYYWGIYVPGSSYDEAGMSEDHWSRVPSNFAKRGAASERHAHIDILDPHGTHVMSRDVVIRIHGRGTRNKPLKSLRMEPRRPAGGHEMFPGELLAGRSVNQSSAPGFRRLILRNAGNAFNTSFYNDAFSQSLVSHTGISTQEYLPLIHLINGEYWGLSNIRNPMNLHYIHDRHSIPLDNVALLQQGWAYIRAGTEEDAAEFEGHMTLAKNAKHIPTSMYDEFNESIDLENLALYYALQIYGMNFDWPSNNMRWWRTRKPHPDGANQDGRWRWLVYDMDIAFSLRGCHRVNGMARIYQPCDESRIMLGLDRNPVNRLFVALLDKSPDFRRLFINTMADQMNTSFRPERVVKVLDQFEARIAPYREAHNRRWGVQTGPQPSMYEFARKRPYYQRKHIREAFSIPRDIDVNIDVSGTRPGTVRLNSIRIEPETPGVEDPPYPWSGTYFHGIPLEFEALPGEESSFLGWVVTGASGEEGTTEELLLESNDPRIQFTPTTDIHIRALWE